MDRAVPSPVLAQPSLRGVVALLLCLTTSCASTQANRSRTSAESGQTLASRLSTPSPMPAWPSFLARDYRNHERNLTQKQIALIQKSLALVERCQRAILRYTFPSNRDVAPFVLFFHSHDVAWPHVLWTNNLYFKPEDGTVFPGASGDPLPQWNGIQYDIEHQSCP